MKYLVIHGSIKNESGGVFGEFELLDDAKQFVSNHYPEFILTNDDADNRNGYRCRYLYDGYPEGLEIFILERRN